MDSKQMICLPTISVCPSQPVVLLSETERHVRTNQTAVSFRVYDADEASLTWLGESSSVRVSFHSDKGLSASKFSFSTSLDSPCGAAIIPSAGAFAIDFAARGHGEVVLSFSNKGALLQSVDNGEWSPYSSGRVALSASNDLLIYDLEAAKQEALCLRSANIQIDSSGFQSTSLTSVEAVCTYAFESKLSSLQFLSADVLALASYNDTVSIFDVRANKIVSKSYAPGCLNVQASPLDPYLIAGVTVASSSISFFDLRKLRPVGELSAGEGGHITSFSISPHKRNSFVACWTDEHNNESTCRHIILNSSLESGPQHGPMFQSSRNKALLTGPHQAAFVPFANAVVCVEQNKKPWLERIDNADEAFLTESFKHKVVNDDCAVLLKEAVLAPEQWAHSLSQKALSMQQQLESDATITQPMRNHILATMRRLESVADFFTWASNVDIDMPLRFGHSAALGSSNGHPATLCFDPAYASGMASVGLFTMSRLGGISMDDAQRLELEISTLLPDSSSLETVLIKSSDPRALVLVKASMLVERGVDLWRSLMQEQRPASILVLLELWRSVITRIVTLKCAPEDETLTVQFAFTISDALICSRVAAFFPEGLTWQRSHVFDTQLEDLPDLTAVIKRTIDVFSNINIDNSPSFVSVRYSAAAAIKWLPPALASSVILNVCGIAARQGRLDLLPITGWSTAPLLAQSWNALLNLRHRLQVDKNNKEDTTFVAAKSNEVEISFIHDPELYFGAYEFGSFATGFVEDWVDSMTNDAIRTAQQIYRQSKSSHVQQNTFNDNQMFRHVATGGAPATALAVATPVIATLKYLAHRALRVYAQSNTDITPLCLIDMFSLPKPIQASEKDFEVNGLNQASKLLARVSKYITSNFLSLSQSTKLRIIHTRAQAIWKETCRSSLPDIVSALTFALPETSAPIGDAIACLFCGSPLIGPSGRMFAARSVGADESLGCVLLSCSKCSKSRPSCVLCGEIYSLYPDTDIAKSAFTQVQTHLQSKGHLILNLESSNVGHNVTIESMKAIKNEHKASAITGFSYCTKCLHGGCIKHVSDWFANNDLCPSSGCSCNCKTLM